MRSHPYPVSSSSPPPAPRPSRSGEPWTAEDYAAVVEACRDQEKPTIETVADAVGRTPNALRGRIKALLPLDLRGGPADMVPGQLRTALLTDDTYDWQTHLMATPPPAPVVEPSQIHKRLPTFVAIPVQASAWFGHGHIPRTQREV